MKTDRIKSDHDALLGYVGGLRELVQAGIPENAEAIFRELMKISASIKLHLAIEDRILYPALMAAVDPRIAATGKRYQQEMGNLAEIYTGFATRWNAAFKISEDPDAFRREANDVFKALHARIQREESELLPLAESL